MNNARTASGFRTRPDGTTDRQTSAQRLRSRSSAGLASPRRDEHGIYRKHTLARASYRPNPLSHGRKNARAQRTWSAQRPFFPSRLPHTTFSDFDARRRRRTSPGVAAVCGNIVGVVVVVVVVIRRLTGPRTPPRAGRRMAQIFFFDLFPKKITNFTVSADPARINAVRVLFVVLRRTLCYFRFLQHRNNFTTP